MKFTAFALCGAVTLSTLFSVAAVRGVDEDSKTMRENKSSERRRDLKGSKDPKGPKGGKGHSSGRSCPTCAETLPGYSFFGQNYLDKDFWRKAVEKATTADFAAYTALPTGTCLVGSPCPSNSAIFGEDFLVPGPFGISTGRESCYTDQDNFQFCLLVAGLAELLYTNDLFRCLLTSLVTTVRDLTCLELDTTRRQLEDGSSTIAFSNEDLLLNIPAIAGWTSFGDIESFFGINIASDLFGIEGTDGRKLGPKLRGDGPTAEDLVNDFFPLDEILDAIYRDSDNVQAIRGNLFLAKCNIERGLPLGLCAGIFALLKTVDASVCYYRNELGCGSDTCTKDLAFDVAYNTERLVVDLPLGGGPASLVIADILSPCDACILEESGGCSAFCNLFESYHTCDNVNTALQSLGESEFMFLREGISGFL